MAENEMCENAFGGKKEMEVEGKRSSETNEMLKKEKRRKEKRM